MIRFISITKSALLLFGVLFFTNLTTSVMSLGCSGSTTHSSIVPTNQDLINEGWNLIAWAQGYGGMFNGNTNLHPDATFGIPPADMDNFPLSQSDFQIPYRHLLGPNDPGNDILFITGDHLIWGYMHYESAWTTNGLESQYPFNRLSSQEICCSGGNIVVTACQNDGIGVVLNCGHILYRPALEDPWISIANGDHFTGYNRNHEHLEDLMVWGESNYANDGSHLKNNHNGMKVYIRSRTRHATSRPAVDVNNIGFCPAINSDPIARCIASLEVEVGEAFSIDDGSIDPDGDQITLNQSVTKFGCEDEGIQTVTLTVTDTFGRSSTCTSTVHVISKTPTVSLESDFFPPYALIFADGTEGAPEMNGVLSGQVQNALNTEWTNTCEEGIFNNEATDSTSTVLSFPPGSDPTICSVILTATGACDKQVSAEMAVSYQQGKILLRYVYLSLSHKLSIVLFILIFDL